MKTRIIAAALALLTLASTSSSASTQVAGPSGPPLTRAEVMADFQVWRQAGMQEFTQPEVRDVQPERYRQALERYRSARSSPAFSALVERLRGSPMVVTSSAANTL